MTIGERIRERRLELNLTQDELAKKAGYKSRSSINKIELSRDLPLRKIVEMAKALEIKPSELAGWSDTLKGIIADNPEYRAAMDIANDVSRGFLSSAIQNDLGINDTDIEIITAFRNLDQIDRIAAYKALHLDHLAEEEKKKINKKK